MLGLLLYTGQEVGSGWWLTTFRFDKARKGRVGYQTLEKEGLIKGEINLRWSVMKNVRKE